MARPLQPRVVDPRHPLVERAGASGWLATAIDTPRVDWSELSEIIDTSYRQVALVRQIQALDN